MIREELPKRLMKKNFLVKIPPIQDEESDFQDPEKDPEKITVAAVADDCELAIGDEVIMQNTAKDEMGNIIRRGAEPLLVLEIAGEQYAMFRELDVEGVW
jgi:hypothetical protein